MRLVLLLLAALLCGCIRAHVHKHPELIRLKSCVERYRTGNSVWLECDGKQMVEMRMEKK